MGSKQGSLYNKLLTLVVGCYRVPHTKVNGTEYGGEWRTGTGTGTGKEKVGRGGRNRTSNGGSERPAQAGRAAKQGGQKSVRW